MTYCIRRCRFALGCFLAAVCVLSLAAAIRPSLGAELQPSSVISLDGTSQLAVDPQNAGREQKWFEKNPAETKEARVPGIIQECYPCYHGVASCGQA